MEARWNHGWVRRGWKGRNDFRLATRNRNRRRSRWRGRRRQQVENLLRVGATEELQQKLERIFSLLFARLNQGGENGLRTGSLPGAVFAPLLSRPDEGACGALGAMVGGVYAGEIEKRKQIGAFPPQMIGQAAIGRVAMRAE